MAKIALPHDWAASLGVSARARTLVLSGGLVAAYIGITARMTDPAFRNISKGLIGCCDSSQQAWAYWWTRYALETGRWPLATNYLFHPQELGATALTTLVSYNTLLAVPLQLLFGLNAAINLLVLASIVLSGLGAYLLIRRETGHSAAAFVGSLMFAFTPPLFARLAYGHYATVAVWPTPFLLLAWRIALRDGSGRAALGAGALLALQSSVSPYQGSYAVVLMTTLGLVAFWRSWRMAGRGDLMRRFLRVSAITILAGFVLVMPHIVSIYRDLGEGRTARVPLTHANSFAPDLLAYVTPSPFHPHLRDTFVGVNKQIGSLDPVRVVFPGYLALMLGAVGVARGLFFRRDREVKVPWTVSLVTMFLLSLGPLLHLNGKTKFVAGDLEFTIPLPFILFWHLPIVGEGRVTANMAFSVSLCLAVLAGSTLAELSSKLRSAAVAWLVALPLAAIVLYEGLATPLSVPTTHVPSFYTQIAAEPGEFAILEVPLGWRDGRRGLGEFRTELLYYATVHRRPMVNGYVSRASDEHFEFYEARPALSYLIDPNRPPAPEAQNGHLVRQTLRDFHVRYVILQPHQHRPEVAQYLERIVGLARVYGDDRLWVYRLE